MINDEISRLEKIKNKVLNRFLDNSDFENVKGVFDMFRIALWSYGLWS